MKRFRGGLVFKAHRLVYHSTLGWKSLEARLGSNPEGEECRLTPWVAWCRSVHTPNTVELVPTLGATPPPRRASPVPGSHMLRGAGAFMLGASPAGGKAKRASNVKYLGPLPVSPLPQIPKSKSEICRTTTSSTPRRQLLSSELGAYKRVKARLWP